MATEPEAHPGRRYALLALKLAVSGGLLTWLFVKVDVRLLWASARQASLLWLSVALVLNFLTLLASIWRWRLLLGAQGVHIARRTLFGSFLVALFFNNFLPSNIGGDVIRIGDTAGPARSKTVATLVVLADRVIGLIGLVLVAAIGATVAAGGAAKGPVPIWPAWLWAGFVAAAIVSAPAVLAPAGVGRLLRPLTVLHPEWIGDKIGSVTAVLARFRDHPRAIAECFCGAVVVQAMTVLYYVAIAFALHVNISPWDLAVIVPVSFIIQMAPVSVNGFGVREATFSFYFNRVGLPIESAVLVSLTAVSLIMIFSLSGAVVWFVRGHR